MRDLRGSCQNRDSHQRVLQSCEFVAFRRVNGDRRAFGEMNAQEKTHMELLRMYQKNPAEVEKVRHAVAAALVLV